MIVNLVLGLPGDRPGGLVLSILLTVGVTLVALPIGILLALLAVGAPRLSFPAQMGLAVARGTPLLLLVFLVANTGRLTILTAGVIALLLYSASHVSEIFRSYVAAYPTDQQAQAQAMGLGPVRRWAELRVPWAFCRSFENLTTHWISLFKDTGALTILGIGELTTVTRVLSANAFVDGWLLLLSTAAALYLASTLGLITVLHRCTRSLARRLP